MFKIRNVSIEDLPDLLEVEQLCFTKEEAATKEAFKKRIAFISDSFFVALEDDRIVGLVFGPVIEKEYITDDLFSEVKPNPETGGHQSILGLAVSPNFQGRGIASMLLEHIETHSKAKNRQTITLTCKEKYIGYYENHGYVNKGLSESKLGGVSWYNMVKHLVNLG